jgi:hypothetical protein
MQPAAVLRTGPARERLGKETRVRAGGHLVAPARPEELAEELLRLEPGVR